MQASLPAPAVGVLFAKTYYEQLARDPHSVGKFYKDTSVISRSKETVDEEDVIASAVGSTDIQGEILAFLGPFDKDMDACKTKITSVSSQESQRGSLMVLVTGYLTLWKERQPRHFSQAFYLQKDGVEAGEGYFVLNDTFRYLDGAESDAVIQMPQGGQVDPLGQPEQPLSEPLQELPPEPPGFQVEEAYGIPEQLPEVEHAEAPEDPVEEPPPAVEADTGAAAGWETEAPADLDSGIQQPQEEEPSCEDAPVEQEPPPEARPPEPVEVIQPPQEEGIQTWASMLRNKAAKNPGPPMPQVRRPMNALVPPPQPPAEVAAAGVGQKFTGLPPPGTISSPPSGNAMQGGKGHKNGKMNNSSAAARQRRPQ